MSVAALNVVVLCCPAAACMQMTEHGRPALAVATHEVGCDVGVMRTAEGDADLVQTTASWVCCRPYLSHS